MFVFDIDQQNVKDVILEYLKKAGVRFRFPKKLKEEKRISYPEHQIFQKPLRLQTSSEVSLRSGARVWVSSFVVQACSCISDNLDTEGVFRKAGSAARLRESRVSLNSGEQLGTNHNVIDAANLLKQFFRELPQPLLPFDFHELLLRCLLLPTISQQTKCMLLSCLLLPKENICTLAFFMEVLHEVSFHSELNKMDVKNLSIIITPTIMPVDSKASISNTYKLSKHIQVVQMLIENAEHIGAIPADIATRLSSDKSPEHTVEKTRKKRRNGSITRVFNGIRKMVVQRGGSSTPEWDTSSPCKRKAPPVEAPFSNKKKKLVLESLPHSSLFGTQLKTRMDAYDFKSNVPYPTNLRRAASKSPPGKRRGTFLTKHLTIRGDRISQELSAAFDKKPSKHRTWRKVTAVSTNDLHVTPEKIQQSGHHRQLSLINWGRKKRVSNETLQRSQISEGEGGVDLSPDDEFVKIPKTEYEEIKNRVSLLEQQLTHELGTVPTAGAVQSEYERTLGEAERLNDSQGQTDALAKRLSRELKIRRSNSVKVIRSPSARKIGSLRRRSRELIQKQLEATVSSMSSLKRGRPNTLMTGLPSPTPLRGGVRTRSNSRSASFGGHEGSQWVSGDSFFSNLSSDVSTGGRPSIIKIRNQNAGMVLAKTKLFSSFNQKTDSSDVSQDEGPPCSGSGRTVKVRVPSVFKKVTSSDDVKRCKSMRVEQVRRSNSPNSPGRRKIGAPRNRGSKSPGKRHRQDVENKENVDKAPTPGPKPQTPHIKQSLAPRTTSLSQARSTTRPRATPLKAIDPHITPHRTLRQSPRLLAMTLSRRANI